MTVVITILTKMVENILVLVNVSTDTRDCSDTAVRVELHTTLRTQHIPYRNGEANVFWNSKT